MIPPHGQSGPAWTPQVLPGPLSRDHYENGEQVERQAAGRPVDLAFLSG